MAVTSTITRRVVLTLFLASTFRLSATKLGKLTAYSRELLDEFEKKGELSTPMIPG